MYAVNRTNTEKTVYEASIPVTTDMVGTNLFSSVHGRLPCGGGTILFPISLSWKLKMLEVL